MCELGERMTGLWHRKGFLYTVLPGFSQPSTSTRGRRIMDALTVCHSFAQAAGMTPLPMPVPQVRRSGGVKVAHRQRDAAGQTRWPCGAGKESAARAWEGWWRLRRICTVSVPRRSFVSVAVAFSRRWGLWRGDERRHGEPHGRRQLAARMRILYEQC